MSEAPDPLEAELSALRPQALSPGLRRRVAERLAESPRARRRWRWQFALAGSLAAACLAVVLIPWGGGRRVAPPPSSIRPQPAPVAEAEDSGPSVRAYQCALARSPAELDALLDKHAVVAPDPNPEFVHLGAFPGSHGALHALLGEP
jgi:hypothetical protein